MNDFHAHSFKHIFDQPDATNFNQWQNLTFQSALINYQLFKRGLPNNPQSAPTKG